MSHSTLADGIRHLRDKLALQGRKDDSDEQLLHDFTSRCDDSAFAVLVHRHGPMVLHVCRRVLGHHQDAEDAFQATFLVLARNAAALRNKATLASFLHGTAYRTAMKAKQSAARRRKYEGQASCRSPADPADELSWREVRALLDEEIAHLPEIYRSVFVLCCLENASREETARRLGLKEGTISSRLAEARRRLAQRLARRGVELTAVLAATGLTAQQVSALPAALMATTIKAALATAAGEGLAGIVSASIVELVQGMTTAMMVSKAKMIAVLLVTATLLVGGGAWTYRTLATPQPGESQTEAPATPSRPTQGHKAETPQKGKGDSIMVTGRVLDPDGKPVSGAKLFAPARMKKEPSFRLDVLLDLVGTTDGEGRFRVTIHKLDLNLPDKLVQNYLIAHAAGFGVDWVELREDQRMTDVMLRLVKDVPITGRVVNTEGRPVAGISLSIAEIFVPANEKLDDYLAGWLSNWRDNLSTPRKRLLVPLDRVTGTAKTDKDGRFVLHGAGRERIVYVKLFGGGMARETLHVITRPGFDAAPYNAVLRSDENIKRHLALNPFRGLDPPSLTFVAQPGKTIEGTIKDADSGKPLPGCGVSVYIAWSESVETVSDAEGKYRLEGVPKRTQGYDISARPANGAPYLFRREHVEDTAGFEKVQLDLALVRGVVVTGRVVDKQTGKGVWASVNYAPLADNKFIGSKPGFNSDRRGAVTDKTNGRFRFVTIPGRALLSVQVHEGEKFHGEPLLVYRKTGPDPDHKDLFKYDPDGDFWFVVTADGTLEILSVAEAAKVVDVKENGETRVDFFADRGVTAQIAVQDADGKPLAGAWASGLADRWPIAYKLPEATATVYALNPDKPRTMAFYHPEKKLGGTAVVRGDEKEPVVVKLVAVGKVSGRLLDGDGNPLDGVDVSINPPGVIGSELYRFAAPSGKPLRTDKDGRFHIEGVVPNLKFGLNLQQQRTSFVGEPRIGVKQIGPGETLDLGNIRVKPAQ